MVYAMNLGFVVEPPRARFVTSSAGHVVLSHMRYAERRMETSSAATWFAGRGFTTSYVGRDGVGAHLEAGDAFAWGDGLVVGYGPRTDELGLKVLATELGVRVRGLRITHPGMYHLDLAFCPLDDRRAIVCPAAFDDESAEALLALVPEPLVITEEEALTTFAANSIVIGRTVLMPACPSRRHGAQLEEWGFEVVLVDVSQFHLGGGSIRCLTNPIDVRLGRDLRVAAHGGEVVAAVRSVASRHGTGGRHRGDAAGIGVSGAIFALVALVLRDRLGPVTAWAIAGFWWSLVVIALVTLLPTEADVGIVPAEGRRRPAPPTSAARRPTGSGSSPAASGCSTPCCSSPPARCWCWARPAGGSAGCWCRSGWPAWRRTPSSSSSSSSSSPASTAPAT